MEEMYQELNDLGLPLICAGGIGSKNELIKALEIDLMVFKWGLDLLLQTNVIH